MRQTGYEGMPDKLRTLATIMTGAKVVADTNVLPMMHIKGIKQGDDKTEAGHDVLMALEDRKVWMPAAVMAYTRFLGAEHVSMISDAYIKVYSLDEVQPDSLLIGQLQEEFQKGDMEVREAMTGVICYDDHVEQHIQIEYVMDDVGQLVWAEPEWHEATTDEDSGYLAHVLRVVLGHEQPSIDEMFDMAQLYGRVGVYEHHK